MAELKGKSFTFGDETALLQPAVVVGGGVKLEEFSKYSFLKHYDNIAKAVLSKDFDAGILKDTSSEERTAFLELKADTAEGKAILTELDAAYNGFVRVEDKDYDEIRKLIAPFQTPAAK